MSSPCVSPTRYLKKRHLIKNSGVIVVGLVLAAIDGLLDDGCAVDDARFHGQSYGSFLCVTLEMGNTLVTKHKNSTTRAGQGVQARCAGLSVRLRPRALAFQLGS